MYFSIRCKRLDDACAAGDRECRNKPLSYSYNFLSFPQNVKIPADLFAMSGPRSRRRYYDWELEIVSVRPEHSGVMKVNRGYFDLQRKSNKNEAVITLRYNAPGPQDIELRMTMKIYDRNTNVYLGRAVSRIFLYVTSADVISMA